MAFASNATELIGGTPLVRLNRVAVDVPATVLAKLEYLNPGGSSKDRIAARMVEAAEADGSLRPGGTIVEPTSGNTGVGLALVAQQRGYRAIFVLPDKVSRDKIRVLGAYGAQVVVTPADVAPDDPRSYYSVADRLVEGIPGAWQPNQYANPNAPASHYATTGPEIWAATEGRITHFIAGIGTGGTITGTGHYLKEVSGGRVQVIGVDPAGSIYSDPNDVHGYAVEGVGEDFYPEVYDRDLPDRIEQVDDHDAFVMTRRLACEEGLLVGGSSGMAVQGALRALADAGPDALAVVLLPDGGRGYIGTVFDDDWLTAHGLASVTEDAPLPDDTALQPLTGLADPGATSGTTASAGSADDMGAASGTATDTATAQDARRTPRKETTR
ncbi:pyridoxal-phosphate dependent enzyme [Pseudoclavibacter caeni]|jgi:cystathionine beta-synthase|uniref:Pyridoxal-phosphate dependent enzyme n=1 Tax=Pseudoclavibacter caeni TaxID=908846 RepID=A0A7C8FVA5_9MICO|nr:pyridoxal-phosphate dependent enzyme [Pseudoclavibacter caeni]KAB1633799.1 pyridoxal-phosphate dependent enzyme [Pseudoclavibacter caeni]NYJ96159.1 cystathionine beta-synthase [Pseudoclavibacter caeni]